MTLSILKSARFSSHVEDKKTCRASLQPKYNRNSDAEISEFIHVDSRRRNEPKLHKSSLRTTMGKYFLVELARL